MADVFVSYARSTARQANAVAEGLRAQGYSVWIDAELPSHRAFRQVIQEQLTAAPAVIVIWSPDAAVSDWVCSEASRARGDDKLVQVRVERTSLPMPFDQIQCADLGGWTGESDHHGWRMVLASVAELVGRGRGRDAPGNGSSAEPASHAVPDPGARPALALPDKPSIAVLPFKNLSGDPGQEYFADAVTEDIVTALSRWRWFFVIDRHSSFTYKDRNVELARISRELGVHYILEGSVRTAGGRARVTAQLVDALTGSMLWADKLDRDLADILALQDEITEQVVAAIEPAMLQSVGARLGRKGPVDFTALDCCYRGMCRLNSKWVDSADNALALFQEAISREPQLALGHIGVARILYGRAILGFAPDPVETLHASREAAQTGIHLDPQDAYGYFAAAGASLYLGDHASALDEVRRAISLNPNFAYAHYRLGQVLTFSGAPAEAVAPIERSLRLSPYDPQMGTMLETLALAHYHSGNYEEAARHAKASSRVAGAGSRVLVASLARLGRIEEAARASVGSLPPTPSPRRPLAPPYSDPSHLQHLREGYRLAGRNTVN
ncbi:MAG TPA: TIR domain-containing protein [Caulobacteraceae bacterium]|nr:TIR domain-containing protein [Caulobacteraceae bacterium]